MTTRMPAEAFPVSEFITEEMGERGWSKDQLAEMLVWSHVALDALLVEDAPLTDEQAADLERVFAVSQRFWLNLETSYRRWFHAKHRARFAMSRPPVQALGGGDEGV